MASIEVQDGPVPARIMDDTMVLEWIVLVEDFPNKARERVAVRK